MSTHLNGHHRRTLDSIFRHPTSHNVEWHDVLSLLNNVGDAQEQHNGKVEITVGTDRIIIARAHGNDVGGDELRQLRAFLSKAGLDPDESHPLASHETQRKPDEQPWIVVVDHHHAKLFAIGDAPGEAAAPLILSPEDPDGHLRHLEHRREGDRNGGRVPEDDGYYERIAADLRSASQIVILSDGTGKSNAGVYLLAYLRDHHAEIADAVVDIAQVDISHLTDGEIIVIGRGHLRSQQPV